MRDSKMIRYLCSELVHITSLDGVQRPRHCGNLEEIGEDFAEVLTQRAFPRNASVRIASKTYQMDGIVESCTFERPLGYFVKVKLAPSSWSEQWFKPKHMLRLGPPEPEESRAGAASGSGRTSS